MQEDKELADKEKIEELDAEKFEKATDKLPWHDLEEALVYIRDRTEKEGFDWITYPSVNLLDQILIQRTKWILNLLHEERWKATGEP